MASNRSSAGDPAKTLALLWGVPLGPAPGSRRGPRQAHSTADIAAAAIRIADTEGLDALTMRRLAQELGLSPMAIYTYVPGKAELLDLMLDTLYATMPRSTPAEDTWRARATAVADDNRALYAAHPWTAAVPTSRPPLGPGQMAKYEYELNALADTGLDDLQLDAALTHLLGFVHTCARMAADERAAHQDSAMNDQQWWDANAELLARVLDPARYPTATRVGTAAGEAHGAAYHPDHAYDFGLPRILDGLAALIAADS